MSLLGNVSNFQDLLGEQPGVGQDPEFNSIIIDDSLTLNYANPDENLVTDADNKVVSEPKDSFVDAIDQITWINTGRQFTASLPQSIAITSDVQFNSVETKTILFDTANSLIIKDETSDEFIVCESVGGVGGTTTIEFDPVVPPTVTISTTNTTNDTIVTTAVTTLRGALSTNVFSNTDSFSFIFDIVGTAGNNLWIGVASTDYTTSDLESRPSDVAQDYAYYNSSNGNIIGNYIGAPTPTGINVVSGDKVRVTLSGGLLTYEFDTGSGFGSSISIILDPSDYRIGVHDGNTASSSFNGVLTGTVTSVGGFKQVSVKQILETNNVIPDVDITYDIGTTDKRYLNIYGQTLESTTGNITTVNSTTIGATTGNITTVNSTTIGATTGEIDKVILQNGSASAPALTWSSNTDVGFFKSGTTTIQLGLDGVQGSYLWNTTNFRPFVDNAIDNGFASTKWKNIHAYTYYADVGSVGMPSYSFTGNATDGIAHIGGFGTLVHNSVAIANWGSTGIFPAATDTFNLGSSSIKWNDIHTNDETIYNSLTLDSLSAYDVLYLDADKKVVGVNLPEDNLLVGTATVPTAVPQGSFYELHQNQLGSKWDPLKTGANMTILDGGIAIDAFVSTEKRRAICVNYFNIPNVVNKVRNFGIEITELNAGNLYFGFCLASSSLDNPNQLDSGSYAVRNFDGLVYENGVSTGITIGSFVTGDIIHISILTNDKWEIYKNSSLIPLYSSTNVIVSNEYFPQVFDASTTNSYFNVYLRPGFDSSIITSQAVISDRIVMADDGSETEPCITFASGADTGFRKSASQTIRYTSGGSDRYQLSDTSFRPTGDITYNLGNSANRWLETNTGDMTASDTDFTWGGTFGSGIALLISDVRTIIKTSNTDVGGAKTTQTFSQDDTVMITWEDVQNIFGNNTFIGIVTSTADTTDILNAVGNNYVTYNITNSSLRGTFTGAPIVSIGVPASTVDYRMIMNNGFMTFEYWDISNTKWVMMSDRLTIPVDTYSICIWDSNTNNSGFNATLTAKYLGTTVTKNLEWSERSYLNLYGMESTPAQQSFTNALYQPFSSVAGNGPNTNNRNWVTDNQTFTGNWCYRYAGYKQKQFLVNISIGADTRDITLGAVPVGTRFTIRLIRYRTTGNGTGTAETITNIGHTRWYDGTLVYSASQVVQINPGECIYVAVNVSDSTSSVTWTYYPRYQNITAIEL